MANENYWIFRERILSVEFRVPSNSTPTRRCFQIIKKQVFIAASLIFPLFSLILYELLFISLVKRKLEMNQNCEYWNSDKMFFFILIHLIEKKYLQFFFLFNTNNKHSSRIEQYFAHFKELYNIPLDSNIDIWGTNIFLCIWTP